MNQSRIERGTQLGAGNVSQASSLLYSLTPMNTVAAIALSVLNFATRPARDAAVSGSGLERSWMRPLVPPGGRKRHASAGPRAQRRCMRGAQPRPFACSCAPCGTQLRRALMVREQSCTTSHSQTRHAWGPCRDATMRGGPKCRATRVRTAADRISSPRARSARATSRYPRRLVATASQACRL